MYSSSGAPCSETRHAFALCASSCLLSRTVGHHRSTIGFCLTNETVTYPRHVFKGSIPGASNGCPMGYTMAILTLLRDLHWTPIGCSWYILTHGNPINHPVHADSAGSVRFQSRVLSSLEVQKAILGPPRKRTFLFGSPQDSRLFQAGSWTPVSWICFRMRVLR